MASSPVPTANPITPTTPATPLRIPKAVATYNQDTQDYDLRSQINIQLLDTGHIHTIHEALLHALHAHPSDWPSRIQAHALQLLRSGEITSFPKLVERVLADIKRDQKRGADVGLAIPAAVVEEGVRVTKDSLEQVCEVIGGND
ncbi:uncharacterized protein PAC_07038 [Phialocephala subalpina]|uniref:Uncharacterized protein n=1 Tax=Phialocephala subalpina TaxID=576137 RepID=A0A1L7WWK5_9HELO|nr:uncharacterized protein PAC_07038 [Phialocephala subalpina]